MATFKASTKWAMIYDENKRYIGRRRVYEQVDNKDSFVFINGFIESVYFLTSRKGYTIAIEGA